MLQRSGAPTTGQLNVSADSFRVQMPQQKMIRIIQSSTSPGDVSPRVTFANLTQQSRVAGAQVSSIRFSTVKQKIMTQHIQCF